MPGYLQMLHLNHYLITWNIQTALCTCPNTLLNLYCIRAGHSPSNGDTDQLLGTAAVCGHFNTFHTASTSSEVTFMWSLGTTGNLPLTVSWVHNLNACTTVTLVKLKINPSKNKTRILSQTWHLLFLLASFMVRVCWAFCWWPAEHGAAAARVSLVWSVASGSSEPSGYRAERSFRVLQVQLLDFWKHTKEPWNWNTNECFVPSCETVGV